MASEETTNFHIFRDSLSSLILRRIATKPQKSRKQRGSKVRNTAFNREQLSSSGESPSDNAEDLGDFIEYLATEIFTSLPEDLRTLSYAAISNQPALAAKYEDPLSTETLEGLVLHLPNTVIDSFTTYNLLPPTSSLHRFLASVFADYIAACTAAPSSVNPAVRATACELCERDWIPLTYHHLIPRQVQEKVLKRGWHEEWKLNSVAWLCRACHSFVHGIGSNEELAREWWSVELLKGREDVQRWAKWVGRVRWKAR